MLDLYHDFWQRLEELQFPAEALKDLQEKTHAKLFQPIQGDYPRWLSAYEKLPNCDDSRSILSSSAITCVSESIDAMQVKKCYEQLIPWRKGPFDMFATYIDSEWQSQMKWNRIKNTLPELKYKKVLDVGCGNGYYLFRMHQESPDLLVGIDPGLLQLMQFWSIEKYYKSQACVLPLSMENMPEKLNYFDVVFSMGVLYHRKSPIHHLKELADALQPKGHLVLETLVVDGDEKTCLMPSGRYAQMRNVWFLPSVAMLILMLERSGFHSVSCIDVTTTTTEEQRSTEWMKFHSLQQFLNAEQSQTIEGYDLPKRATLLAQKK